jgi:hypothetical protein
MKTVRRGRPGPSWLDDEDDRTIFGELPRLANRRIPGGMLIPARLVPGLLDRRRARIETGCPGGVSSCGGCPFVGCCSALVCDD